MNNRAGRTKTREGQKKSQASLAPQRIDVNNWYYEARDSIQLVHEVRDMGAVYLQTDMVRIPLRKLIATLERLRPGLFR